MATITKRKGKDGKITYHARVRRLDYDTVCMRFDTKRQAQDWAAGVENLMTESRYVVDKHSRRVTLEQVIDEYLKRRVPNLKGRQPKYETVDWKERPLAKRIIGKITVADIIEWIDERSDEWVGLYRRDMRGRILYGRNGKPLPGLRPRKIRPKTVLNELTRLSAIFTWAQSELEMHALVNPVKLVPDGRRPKAKGRDRRLKRGELNQLLQAAKRDELPIIGSIIEFAVETACRRAEITKLQLKDYDAEALTIDVRDTKNGDDRTIGLSPRATQILERIIEERGLLDPDAWFFPVDPDEVSRSFRRCCSATEIGGQEVKPIGGLLDFDGLTFHDLRHEGTSRYFEKGLKMQEVAHQTGHRNYQSLKRYTHPKGKSIAQKLAGAQLGAAGDD